MDERTLKDTWGALAFRGVVTILFGIAAVFWPGLTLATLVYLFGAFILVSGLANQIAGLINIGGGDDTFWSRILLILLGLAEVGLGIYLLRHPGVSLATFILIAGLGLIIHALFDLFAGIFNGGGALYRTVMILGGIVTGLAGIVLLFQPVSGGVAFVWILGIYALITGPLQLALAFEAKNSIPPAPTRGRRAKAAR